MPRMANAALELPLLDDQPAVILMGRDEQGKPHAAWFSIEQKSAAEAAAVMMGMTVLSVGEDAGLREKALRLARGKVFASGKAFVPFVNGTLYTELGGEPAPERSTLQVVARRSDVGPKESGAASTRAARSLRSVKMSGTGPSGSAPASGASSGKAGISERHYPDDWSKIRPGSHVLAHEGHDAGWYEAVVLNVAPGGNCTLRWRDYPTEPQFKRHTSDIGLLPLPEDQEKAAS